MQGNNLLYWLLDKSGEVILTNASFDPNQIPGLVSSVSKGLVLLDNEKARFGRAAVETGTVFLVTTDKTLVQSSRIFEEKLKIYSDFLSTIIEVKKKIIDDTLHNLTKIHGHSIQEIHNVIPEEFLLKGFDKQVDSIREEIVSNLEDTAIAFIQVIRNNRIMNAEFDNIRLIHGGEINRKPQLVKINPVIQSILYLYDQDFQNKQIRVAHSESPIKVNFDYNLFAGALIPIFENLIKYSKREGRLRIDYLEEGDNIIIRFNMFSLKFLREEEKDLLVKNYSGQLAKKVGKNGKGLGMYHAKRLLSMNDAVLKLYYLDGAKEEGDYRENILDIVFQK